MSGPVLHSWQELSSNHYSGLAVCQVSPKMDVTGHSESGRMALCDFNNFFLCTKHSPTFVSQSSCFIQGILCNLLCNSLLELLSGPAQLLERCSVCALCCFSQSFLIASMISRFPLMSCKSARKALLGYIGQLCPLTWMSWK